MSLNVLSIDWDYFMDCTNEERNDMFPDGGSEDIGVSTSTMVWGIRYGATRLNKWLNKDRKELTDVGIDREKLDIVKQLILEGVNSGCTLMFADSHAEIYSTIYNRRRNKRTKFNVYNIDHHSDCYDIGDDVNCGNWVNHLDKEGVISKYVWIKGDSNEELGEDTLTCETKVTDDLSVLKHKGWDVIFICRSSIWSPPHLDVEFNEFYAYLDAWLSLNLNPKFFIDRFSAIEGNIDLEAKREYAIKQISKCNLSDNNVVSLQEYLDAVSSPNVTPEMLIESGKDKSKSIYDVMREVTRHNRENCDCTEELEALQEIINNMD